MHEQLPGNNKASRSTTTAPQQATQSPPVSQLMNPSAMSPSQILQLQRSAGNRAMQGMVAQRNGNGNAPPPSNTPTPEQTRKTELDTYRDIEAPAMAQDTLRLAKQKLKSQIDLYLSKGDQTSAMRASLQTTATKAVERNMENASGADAKVKADAKKYAKEYTETGVNSSLDAYAGTLTSAELPDTKLAAIEQLAKEGFNTVTPVMKQTLDQQKKKAKDAAVKKVNEWSSNAVTASAKQSKQKVTDKIKTSGSSFLDSTVDVGTAGQEEIDKRNTKDGSLANGVDAEAIYKDLLATPLQAALLSKLGVGRGEFRRSKELNEFRQKLKDSAREQANTEIDTQVISNTPGVNAQAYKKMMAKTKAFKLAKGSVDSVMGDEAAKIIEAVAPKADTKSTITDAAKTAAYEVARINNSPLGKIKEAALAGATKEAGSLLAKKKPLALDKARELVGKKASTSPTTTPSTLQGDVKKKVTDEGIATAAIKSIEAESLNSGFAKLGKLVDLAAPNPGDSSSLSVELKIPIPNSPGLYFLFGFGGEAEREDGELSCNTQLTFGAGFQTFGFDANFRLGLYLDATGKTTTGVMNMMSYGLYREMRSKAPAAADHFWGQGGKSGSTKLEEAERWAMMIEEQEFDAENKNSIDVGLLVQLGMEANAGVAEFSAELAYKRLSRYNKKETVDKTSGITDLKERAKQIGKGEIRNVIEAAAEVGIKFGSTEVAFGLEGSFAWSAGNNRELSIGISANVPWQFGEESSKFTEIASKIVTASVGSAKNLAGMLKGKYDSHKSGKPMDVTRSVGGSVADTGSDVLFMGSHFDSIGTSLAEKIQGDETVNDTIRSWLPGQDNSASPIEEGVNKIALSNSLNLALQFEKSWNVAGTESEWEVSLEASQVKSLEIDAGIVTVEVEKSKRLGKIGFGSEGLTGGLIGIEK